MYGTWKLRCLARQAYHYLARSGIILMYHRVNNLASDPWALAVTPAHFAEHLEVIRGFGTAMRLDRYVQAREERRLPRRPIVITFDDGYADNLHEAKCLLESSDLPATVFISTDHIGADREFWSDDLDRLLLQPGRLPSTLELTIDGQSYRWELGGDAEYTAASRLQHRQWRYWHQVAPTARHQIYRDLWRLLQALRQPDRHKIMEDLRLWTGYGAVGRSTHRMMTADEVRTLAGDGLVEVGSHTVTHLKLSAFPSSIQRREIQQSKWQLEELLGRAVTSFAYPYGDRSMYSAVTVALVQEAGYACACANIPGMVQRGDSRFELPRIRVHDWDGDTFKKKLHQLLSEGHA
jgi:peptidoglycan/xylan/chitin deacetylase (PgdA/CDA1 family)